MQERSFSERYGFQQVSNTIQLKGMSDDLRNSLWNVLIAYVWTMPTFMSSGKDDVFGYDTGEALIDGFSLSLWMRFLKKPIDRRPQVQGRLDRETTLEEIRNYFYSTDWHKVYTFIEFVVKYSRNWHPKMPEILATKFNEVLERELSGYRFIDSLITEISDPLEVDMLKEALADKRFNSVTTHLNCALEFLSDRESPNYRNSIKESISAVESMAKIFANNNGATLSVVLNQLAKDQKISPMLKDGFRSLYSYTSTSDGIRHALMDESNLSQDEAKCFLLICTSFTNYLKAQMAKQPTTP